MANGRERGRIQPRHLVIVIGLLIALSLQPTPVDPRRVDPRPVVVGVLPRAPRRRRGPSYRRRLLRGPAPRSIHPVWAESIRMEQA